jgi:hypothetical protein
MAQSASFDVALFDASGGNLALSEMARLLTTTRSLKSLQPGKEPRRGHGCRFGAGSQAVAAGVGLARGGASVSAADGGGLPAAPGTDVVSASGGGGAFGCAASRADQPSVAASQLSRAEHQSGATTATPGCGVPPRAVPLHHRRDAVQPVREAHGEHLQHRQPPAAATERAAVWKAETHPQELPQLHDGTLDRAVGAATAVLDSALHPRILPEERARAPHDRGSRSRLDPSVAAARRGGSRGAGRYGVRGGGGPRGLRRAGLRMDFPVQGASASWPAASRGPRCVRC